VNFINRIPAIALGLVLFGLSLALRLLNINSTDIAGDEPFSIFMGQLDVQQIVKHLSQDNSPPLFEIILHYYMLWIGESDFLLRFLPTLINSLIVIPVFLIGELFFNRRVALSAAILFILSIYHIRFAHEIRVYSLFSFVFSWLLYFFLSLVKNPKNQALTRSSLP